MFQLYYTAMNDSWENRQLIWQSDMAVDPAKYGIYNMRCGLEVNKAGELQFLMTKSCSSYNLFTKERSVLTLLQDGTKTIFRGVVKLIETDLFSQRTITANSELIYLSDSIFEPHGEDVEQTPRQRFKEILAQHNVKMQGDPGKQIQPGNFVFEYGADTVQKYSKNGGYKDTMSQLKNDLKDFKGFFTIRYDTNYGQKWLDFTETTGQSTSQDLKFAANIEDYQYKDTVDDLFTVLIPFGGDNLTLENQNTQRKVDIRLPDQTKKTIDVYVVDKYMKIVDGITKWGYIYQAENFDVDSNNLTKSGIDGTIGGDSSSITALTGYLYSVAFVGGDEESAGHNPVDEGLFYANDSGFVLATESTPISGRTYYERTQPTFYLVHRASGNPAMDGWYEYTNGIFTRSTDTSVVSNKKYYSRSADTSGGFVYTYAVVSVSSATNPSAAGYYYILDGNYVPATETTITPGRVYYARQTSSTEGSVYRYIAVEVEPNQNPSDHPTYGRLYEKLAFTVEVYQLTADTEPIDNKTYYRQELIAA